MAISYCILYTYTNIVSNVLVRFYVQMHSWCTRFFAGCPKALIARILQNGTRGLVIPLSAYKSEYNCSISRQNHQNEKPQTFVQGFRINL